MKIKIAKPAEPVNGQDERCMPPRIIIQRRGISMTEDEAYKVHIQHTFNAFCKIVIRHAAIDKILNLHRRWEREVSLATATNLIQGTKDMAQKSFNNMSRDGLIEGSGKEYMLTARTYEAVKSTVEYTKDKSIQYIKAKEMIMEYIESNKSITNEKTRELCGFTKQQARSALDKMRGESLIKLVGAGRSSKYIKSSGVIGNRKQDMLRPGGDHYGKRREKRF